MSWPSSDFCDPSVRVGHMCNDTIRSRVLVRRAISYSTLARVKIENWTVGACRVGRLLLGDTAIEHRRDMSSLKAALIVYQFIEFWPAVRALLMSPKKATEKENSGFSQLTSKL